MGLGKCISVLKYVYLLCDVKFQGGVDHLQLYLTVDLRVGGHHIFVYVMVPNLFYGILFTYLSPKLGDIILMWSACCWLLKDIFFNLRSKIRFVLLNTWTMFFSLSRGKMACKTIGFSMHQLLVSSCRPFVWICLTFVGFPRQERSKQKGP